MCEREWQRPEQKRWHCYSGSALPCVLRAVPDRERATGGTTTRCTGSVWGREDDSPLYRPGLDGTRLIFLSQKCPRGHLAEITHVIRTAPSTPHQLLPSLSPNFSFAASFVTQNTWPSTVPSAALSNQRTGMQQGRASSLCFASALHDAAQGCVTSGAENLLGHTSF